MLRTHLSMVVTYDELVLAQCFLLIGCMVFIHTTKCSRAVFVGLLQNRQFSLKSVYANKLIKSNRIGRLESLYPKRT